MENLSNNIVRTADVIGRKIIGINQVVIGKVEELVLDKQNGMVRYAVLARGGLMGIGSEFYAIPWAALEYCTDNNGFKVNISKDDIQKAPGFNKENWPDFANKSWDKLNSDFYNHLIVQKSPMPKEQKDFISEGGNSQPLNKDTQS